MALAQAINHLSVNLHRLLAGEKGNVFFSPFSIASAMAMLSCGATGETAAEMSAALGYDHAEINKEDVATLFEQQMSVLLKCPDSYTLASANSMLSQKGFEVKDQYKSILTESFKALLLEVDFQTEVAKVVSQINNWVKEKTNNMIPKLVDSLDPATVIVLLNAVYFKGSWLHKFNVKCTHPQTFYNKGLQENAKEVDMMHLKENFPFTENESFQTLKLPYKGEELAMLILLPRAKDGLESLEGSLTPSFIRDLNKNLWNTKVDVTLPRFRLEYSKSLISCFQQLGVNRVFQQGAELGIVSDSQNLAVSDIFHKAVLEVNEEGSEAAAATMVSVMLCSISFDPEFIADHPFAFAIYDTRNDLVLFMGRVEEL